MVEILFDVKVDPNIEKFACVTGADTLSTKTYLCAKVRTN